MEQKYDIIIPVASKDVSFLSRVVFYVKKNLVNSDVIYIITNNSNFDKIKKLDCNCQIIDENELYEGLSFSRIKDLLFKYDKTLSIGWFFQQFLKLAFATTNYANKYYLSWDADTLPIREISFFDGDHPLFTKKQEYNENYFHTIEKILGLKKQVPYSFIAEHMLFKPEIVRELLSEIESSTVNGSTWFEKIVNAGDYEVNKQTFSEFETYGSYVTNKYPTLYKSRQLNTFRYGGFIQGRSISDEKIGKIAFDTDTISFELGHEPLFPYNIPQKFRTYKLLLRDATRKYSLSEIFSRALNFVFLKRI